jgi:hypothetical protein
MPLMSEIIPFDRIDPTNFYLTSLSSNTPESIRYDIRQQYTEHPVTGLHKAELYIYGTSQAIRLALDNIATDKRKIDGLTRDLGRLKVYERYRLGFIYFILTRKYLDLEIQAIEAKIRTGQMAIADAVPMLEDAQSELKSALRERVSILERHPEFDVPKIELGAMTDRDRLTVKLMKANSSLGANPGILPLT